jgi:hypothetical protein
MNMNIGYQIYQAERGKSYAEQLQADRQAGVRAAAVTRRWHAIMRTLRGYSPAHQAAEQPVLTSLVNNEIHPFYVQDACHQARR